MWRVAAVLWSLATEHDAKPSLKPKLRVKAKLAREGLTPPDLAL
jgi:hypothetical protein